MTVILAAPSSVCRPSSGMLVDGEYSFTIEDFRAVAAMLHADAGIALSESKATLVYSRLAKRLRATGLTRFRDYCSLISGSDGTSERRQMLTALTTNVTKFFREPHHFEHFKATVLPPLLESAKRGGRLRFWSAACSTGEEPYSLALTILAVMPDAATYDIKVLGTDIDHTVLAHARAGRYTDAAVSAVPPDLRQRWLVRDRDDAWTMGDAVRKLVAFRELNLIGAWPMRQTFQIIMCRNVLIYFQEDTQELVWERFTPLIENGGYLYIGHSERLIGQAAESFDSAGFTIYHKHERVRH